MSKERVSKVVIPENRPSQQEWMEELRVSSGYVKPVDYTKATNSIQKFSETEPTVDYCLALLTL